MLIINIIIFMIYTDFFKLIKRRIVFSIARKHSKNMAQLFFEYGAMSSGKSIEILKVAHNYESQGAQGVADDTNYGYKSWRWRRC